MASQKRKRKRNPHVRYYAPDRKTREQLYSRAATGDKKALKEFFAYSNKMKAEANDRIRKLQRAKLDYGREYNAALYYTQTQLHRNRFNATWEMDYDIDDLYIQNEIIAKFIETEVTTVAGKQAQEEARVKNLIDNSRLPTEFSLLPTNKAKEFLRWLGNEEVTTAIDEFGSSNIVTEIAYDVYEKSGVPGLNVMSKVLTEWLDNKTTETFDEAMERMGVNLADYIKGNKG